MIGDTTACTLDQLAERLAGLRALHAERAHAALEGAAHTLKGSALVLGLDDLAVAMVALQTGLGSNPDDLAVDRALGSAERALALVSAEQRLRRLRHDLRNDLGRVMMGADLLELELDPALAGRARAIVEAAADATRRIDEIRPDEPAESFSQEDSSSSRSRLVGGLRVLVVDDDPQTADTVAALLARNGADVVAVAGLDPARAVLHSCLFDAALVDLFLAGETGEDILPELKELGVRAIAFTGDTSAAGNAWDAVLGKDESSSSLLAALAAAR